MHSASPTILRFGSLLAGIVLGSLRERGRGDSTSAISECASPQADRFLAEGQFELLSLDPALLTEKQRRRLKGKLFHGYRVLGRVEIARGSQHDDLVRVLREALAGAGFGLAYCFDPRHAIRASLGAQAIDLLVCFECSKILVHLPDTSPTRPAQFISTSDSAQPAFDAALKSAGIPLGKRP